MRRGDTVRFVRWLFAAIVVSLASLAIVTSTAVAAPLGVVVREGDDAVAAVRLRGQVADLDVDLHVVPGALEPTLDAQLATAARLAETFGARVVVWFVARTGGGVAVAIATPADHRLFVRELPAADPSAQAEAAAVATRGALRAIAMGGTIGVSVAPSEPPLAPPAPPPQDAATGLSVEATLGWQVALDGGANRGAQALAPRTTLVRGAWATSLALTLGLPLARTGTTEVELARSGAALGIERRFGALSLGASAGAVLYRRATVSTPTDLVATRATTTVAFTVGPEVRWRWQPGRLAVGLEVCAGLDIVIGAPELAVARGTQVESLGRLWIAQPRVMLGLFAKSR